MQTTRTHTHARNTNGGTWCRALTGMLIAVVLVAACGDEEPTGADDPDAAADASGPIHTESIPETKAETTVTSAANDTDDTLPLVDAVVVDTIELPRGDLGFLFSDGEALWATGHDGAIVRIDPDTGHVDELAIGDGLIRGPLLPSVTDDEIWFSEILGSNIVRLDPSSLTSDPPIEVAGAPGQVLVGPGEQMWMTTGPPAGLHALDPDTRTLGDFVSIDTDGEAIGAAVAFESIWVPLYDDRTVLRLDETGAVTDRVPSGVGPSYVREAHGMLWHPNWIDGTISRIDPDGLQVTTIDLNSAGDTIEQPSGISATSDAVWVRAAGLNDRAAIVFRIDPDTAEIVGRRTLPGDRRVDHISNMATFQDRLFVLDRSARALLELDVDQFAADDPTSVSGDDDESMPPDELALRDTLRTLLSTPTSPDDMQLAIRDGERLADQVRAFKQYFDDNLPGEPYEGEVLSVRLDGDRADIEFFVTVAGEPVVEPIPGTMVREDGRWLLTAKSFCRLVATGDITCPADLTATTD